MFNRFPIPIGNDGGEVDLSTIACVFYRYQNNGMSYFSWYYGNNITSFNNPQSINYQAAGTIDTPLATFKFTSHPTGTITYKVDCAMFYWDGTPTVYKTAGTVETYTTGISQVMLVGVVK